MRGYSPDSDPNVIRGGSLTTLVIRIEYSARFKPGEINQARRTAGSWLPPTAF
jgi:hypothetical protein